MLKPIIKNLKEQGLLIPCNSPCNTPILGIKKSNGKWRLVQDLRIINEAVVPLHPVVPNPYTLLSEIPERAKYFSVVDLKVDIKITDTHISQTLLKYKTYYSISLH